MLTDQYPYVEGYLDTVFGGEWKAVSVEQTQGYNGIIATNGITYAHVELLFVDGYWEIQHNVRFFLAAA